MLKTIAALVSAAGLVATIACSQTDAGITTKIKAKFAADDTVKAYQVDVTTQNHVVTLSGDVETSAAKEQAVRLARQTEGVRDVVDKLHVNETAATTGIDTFGDRAKEAGHDAADYTRDAGHQAVEKTEDALHNAGTAIEDAALTTAVKTKFLADSAVKGTKIDVDTSDGIVTLSGTVGSRAEADRAVKIAQQTDGVKKVVNKLRVGA